MAVVPVSFRFIVTSAIAASCAPGIDFMFKSPHSLAERATGGTCNPCLFFFLFFLARRAYPKKLLIETFFKINVKIDNTIDRAPPQKKFPCRVFRTENIGISLQSGAAISLACSAVARLNNHLARFVRASSKLFHATITFPSNFREARSLKVHVRRNKPISRRSACATQNNLREKYE